MRNFNLLWNLYQLKRNEHKTKEQVKAIQEKKLHRLLKIAYEHSPYYHKAFKEAGITEENLLNLPLSAFPTMDKDILMEHFEEIITKPELTQKEKNFWKNIISSILLGVQDFPNILYMTTGHGSRCCLGLFEELYGICPCLRF